MKFFNWFYKQTEHEAYSSGGVICQNDEVDQLKREEKIEEELPAWDIIPIPHGRWALRKRVLKFPSYLPTDAVRPLMKVMEVVAEYDSEADAIADSIHLGYGDVK